MEGSRVLSPGITVLYAYHKQFPPGDSVAGSPSGPCGSIGLHDAFGKDNRSAPPGSCQLLGNSNDVWALARCRRKLTKTTELTLDLDDRILLGQPGSELAGVNSQVTCELTPVENCFVLGHVDNNIRFIG